MINKGNILDTRNQSKRTPEKRKDRGKVTIDSSLQTRLEEAPFSPISISPQPVYSLCLFKPTSTPKKETISNTAVDTSAKNLLAVYPFLFNSTQRLPTAEEEKWVDNVYETGPNSGLDFSI